MAGKHWRGEADATWQIPTKGSKLSARLFVSFHEFRGCFFVCLRPKAALGMTSGIASHWSRVEEDEAEDQADDQTEAGDGAVTAVGALQP